MLDLIKVQHVQDDGKQLSGFSVGTRVETRRRVSCSVTNVSTSSRRRTKRPSSFCRSSSDFNINVYYICYYLEICVALKFIEKLTGFGSDSTSRVRHTQNTQHSVSSVWRSSILVAILSSGDRSGRGYPTIGMVIG